MNVACYDYKFNMIDIYSSYARNVCSVTVSDCFT